MTIDQKIQYENQGFLHLPGVIPAPLVERARRAFDAAVERHKKAGSLKNGEAYFDIPDILDVDDCFVDLVDLPPLMPVLLDAVGHDIQLNHTHARIFFPGPTFTAPWHSDLAAVLGIDLAHSIRFFVKVHLYIEDLSPDQGCLGFLPGTHRLPPDHPRPEISPDSPAAVIIVPKAGDAVLFNTHVMHMALDNTSGKPRKSLIYAYSHFWVKHYANSTISDPERLERLATTPLRKQLLGVETPGVNYFNQRYDGVVRSDYHNTFTSASRRLIKRLIRATSITTKR
ncbi:MAG: phytanoyl-CoA dioxygenase family protein [Planctomycetaceae bacterium]